MSQTILPPAASASKRPPLRRRLADHSWRFLRIAASTAERSRGTTGARTLSAVNRLAETDPARALGLVHRARRLAPRTLAFAQAEALLTARSAGWPAAAPLFREIEALAASERPLNGASAAALLRPQQPTPSVTLALPEIPRQVRLAPGTTQRVVFYTACFGTRPQLPPLFGMPEGLRFLCFTDQAVEARGWEIVPTRAADHPAGYHQICPHEVLAGPAPEAEWSLYLGPDRLVIGNLHTLLARWLMAQDFALWRHPCAIDWHELAEEQLVSGSAPSAAVLHQAEACAAAVLPRDRGVFDTEILWRRHGDAAVAALMEAWWALEAPNPGAAGLSLYRTLEGAQAPAARPVTLPVALGPAQESLFFAQQTRLASARAIEAPAIRTGRLPVAFLYSPKAMGGGTLLRGQQLSQLIAEAYPDRYDVSFVPDIAAVRDQVVIVNQRAIWDNDHRSLASLRARNIATIGDWLDAPVETAKAELFDAHMALSIPQMLALNREHPKTPAFHVTHHVNTEIAAGTPPEDRLRSGYFGSAHNTFCPDALAGAVDIVDVFSCERDWLAALPEYNCHWIVRTRPPPRRKRSFDGWKPFLKGFLAARCGAVVIVTRDDSNAGLYLGDDYPFYAESLEPAELEMAWIRTAAAFGGPEWRFAREIMAQVAERSSDAQVCAEFRAMVEEVVG